MRFSLILGVLCVFALNFGCSSPPDYLMGCEAFCSLSKSCGGAVPAGTDCPSYCSNVVANFQRTGCEDELYSAEACLTSAGTCSGDGCERSAQALTDCMREFCSTYADDALCQK